MSRSKNVEDSANGLKFWKSHWKNQTYFFIRQDPKRCPTGTKDPRQLTVYLFESELKEVVDAIVNEPPSLQQPRIWQIGQGTWNLILKPDIAYPDHYLLQVRKPTEDERDSELVREVYLHNPESFAQSLASLYIQ